MAFLFFYFFSINSFSRHLSEAIYKWGAHFRRCFADLKTCAGNQALNIYSCKINYSQFYFWPRFFSVVSQWFIITADIANVSCRQWQPLCFTCCEMDPAEVWFTICVRLYNQIGKHFTGCCGFMLNTRVLVKWREEKTCKHWKKTGYCEVAAVRKKNTTWKCRSGCNLKVNAFCCLFVVAVA